MKMLRIQRDYSLIERTAGSVGPSSASCPVSPICSASSQLGAFFWSDWSKTLTLNLLRESISGFVLAGGALSPASAHGTGKHNSERPHDAFILRSHWANPTPGDRGSFH